LILKQNDKYGVLTKASSSYSWETENLNWNTRLKQGNLKKVVAILLVISFVISGGISLILTTDSNIGNAAAAAAPLTAGTMAPGTVPHYFGPYANYANSPVPKGSITSITVDSKGSGYTLPTITISDVWGTGSGALASAVLVGGSISSITVTNGGTGYSAPIVTITDSTGTGASATPVMGGALTGGIRKFIDSLPGLTSAGANNLGNYIPVGIPDTTTFPGCDYYEIALVKYTQKMSRTFRRPSYMDMFNLKRQPSQALACTSP
jgi:hypothetical protein